MDFTEIIYEKIDPVATITLNRPDRLNAFNAKMGLEIKQALIDADHDHSIRAIVVTGGGQGVLLGRGPEDGGGGASGPRRQRDGSRSGFQKPETLRPRYA